MRTRLVIAFIVVALLSAIASSWFHTLIEAYRLPAWLEGVIFGPGWLRHLVQSYAGPPGPSPVRHTALVFFGVEAGLLLAMIVIVAIAAARPVLLPVRRLAQATQRMSGGDLSVRIQPEGRDELAQLVTSFNGMAAALEDKVGELEQMEARARQYAGDVSHELRTPLTAMTAVADILHDHPGLTGDAATAARLVRQEVLHLNRLVEDLIEISRFDAGTAQLVTDETDVATAVGRCLRARGWSDVATDVPAGLTARLDRRRFDVILANLVGNAVRHGGPPVTVTASNQPGLGNGGQLAVEVRDHGGGLPPTAIPHLFDRFYKADTARARSEGSGLGLAIAWENARLHGGHLHAANHPDGGAVFTVTLPLDAPRSGDAARPAVSSTAGQTGQSGRPAS
ncbi:MAG TPA: HAMP domain-containing sensor histidine kinase [Streptosporangiaceae bacterium]|nr:HAMP domain-containing sensor histidine kinase [Streptosporangiaceae bacterium]